MALPVRQRAEDDSPAPGAHAVFRRATALFEAGKTEDAAAGFRDALRLDPHYASAWINLGSALRKLRHLEASAACSARALEISPGNPSYLTNYGRRATNTDYKR